MSGKSPLTTRPSATIVYHMGITVHRMVVVIGWLVLGLLILVTSLGLLFAIVVTGLSGGSGTLATAAGACFILLVAELVLVARLVIRRRARYGERDLSL